MGDVERGERNLALQNMAKIAGALGVKISQLMRVMEEEYAKTVQPLSSPKRSGR